MQPTPFTMSTANLCGPPKRPRSNRIAAVGALASIGVVMIASQARAATPPDLVTTKISGAPATLTANSSARLAVTVANRGGRTGKATKTDVLLSADRRRGKDIRIARVATKGFAPHAKRKLRAGVKLPPGVKAGSYFVLACADATAKLRERHEGDNCRAGSRIAIRAAVITPPPAPPQPQPESPAPAVPGAPGAPAPALQLADGIDWAQGDTLNDGPPRPGAILTATARVGNGLPGQAGYDQTFVDPHGPVDGETTTLDFGGDTDDGAAAVDLPFAFPFGGIAYDKAFVSTNGAVSFGEHLADYYVDFQTTDYRGPGAVLSEFTRAVFPYFTDLDLAAVGVLGGTVKVIRPADGSVAMRWQVPDHRQPELRRDVQAVLFADGRIRFDYLGSDAETASANNFAAIGLSTGTGTEALNALSLGARKPPSRSVLYTPHAVVAAPVPQGVVRIATPRASSFASADADCTVVSSATLSSGGIVECATPALNPGESRSVSTHYVRATIDALGNNENQHLTAEWRVGEARLQDAEEGDLAGLTPKDPSIPVQTTPSAMTVPAGTQQTLHYAINGDRLALPTLTLRIPAGVQAVSTTLPRCSALPLGTAGGEIVCLPRDGAGLLSGDLVIKAAAGPQKVEAVLNADNAWQSITGQWSVNGV